MNKITQAFIFCAGRGERMMPLTALTPKPLLQVNNKAILDHILDKLSALNSLEKIIINCYYQADSIEKHIEQLNNPKIIISREIEKIETGGGLIYALDKIDINKPLLTLNGDVLWRDNDNFSDLEYLINNFDPTKHDFLLGLKRLSEYFGYDNNSGDFNFNGQELRRDFLNQNNNFDLNYVYVGLQILNPRILQSGNFPKCFSVSNFYKSAIASDFVLDRIGGVELKGQYFHVGTPQNLSLANSNFN